MDALREKPLRLSYIMKINLRRFHNAVYIFFSAILIVICMTACERSLRYNRLICLF